MTPRWARRKRVQGLEVARRAVREAIRPRGIVLPDGTRIVPHQQPRNGLSLSEAIHRIRPLATTGSYSISDKDPS